MTIKVDVSDYTHYQDDPAVIVVENLNHVLRNVYAERNRLAQALAKMSMEMEYNVGIKDDKEDKDYVILYIDLPTGQVSWHIPKKELIGKFPEYNGNWDSHDTKSKIERVVEYIKRGEMR
jgi:hypothetical protein